MDSFVRRSRRTGKSKQMEIWVLQRLRRRSRERISLTHISATTWTRQRFRTHTTLCIEPSLVQFVAEALDTGLTSDRNFLPATRLFLSQKVTRVETNLAGTYHETTLWVQVTHVLLKPRQNVFFLLSSSSPQCFLFRCLMCHVSWVVKVLTLQTFFLHFFSPIFFVSINAEQVYTQFCVYLYLCQWKCNDMYAINHVYISFI